jgi:predicted esterase
VLLAAAVVVAGAVACASARHADVEPRPAPLANKPFTSGKRSAVSEVVELEVPGFLPSVLVLPASDEPRPLFVVAHGAGDKPEWQCEWWEAALESRAVILCLRGSAMFPRDPNTGFYFRDHHALGRELGAAVAAARALHAHRIAEGPLVFAGFSQGAIMGALIAQDRAPLFERLILVEGGYDEWNVSGARRLGPKARVLFACGQEYCASRARRSMGWLARAGIPARLEHAPRGGHTYAGQVGERVRAALPWLLDGDARFRATVTSSRR